MNSKNRLLIALLFGIGFVGVVAHENKVKIKMDLQEKLELNEKEFAAEEDLMKQRFADMDNDEFLKFLDEMFKEDEVIKEE